MYIAEILPERGVAVAMSVYWLAVVILVVPFNLIYENIPKTQENERNKLLCYYFVLFIISCVSVSAEPYNLLAGVLQRIVCS